MHKAGTIVMWILSVLLALVFIMVGLTKVSRPPVLIEQFEGWGYAPWFLLVIGPMESVGGILLLVPRLARVGVAVLAFVMLGAAYTHVANGEGLEVLRPAIFLALLVAVGVLRGRPRRKATG